MFGTNINQYVACNLILFRAMCHNEEKYPNASEFNPDRFLNPDGTLTDDTVSFVWGFGRRICPGRHLAEASIWSAMVSMLAVFKFSRAKDETGREIEIEPHWHGGLTVYVEFNRSSLERWLTDFWLLGDLCHSLAVSLHGMRIWISRPCSI